MLDIHNLMTSLASRRPIFHSEADFQHALAWQIHLTCPNSDLRLEREQFLPRTAERMATDIWIRLPNAVVAIELKYTNQVEWDDEVFALRDHGAQPPRRYDFIKDIQRLEQTLRLPDPADYGFAVLLTNNQTYWTPPRQNNVIDAAFRIHNSQGLIGGILRWGHNTAAGTMQNREEPIELVGSYKLGWRDYSSFDGRTGGTFRYLAVPVYPMKEPDL